MRPRRLDVTRRRFLRLAAAGVSSAWAPLGTFGLGACAQPLSQQRPSSAGPLPSSPYTPMDDWYYVSLENAYHADLARYRLKLGGIVDDGLSISVP